MGLCSLFQRTFGAKGFYESVFCCKRVSLATASHKPVLIVKGPE